MAGEREKRRSRLSRLNQLPVVFGENQCTDASFPPTSARDSSLNSCEKMTRKVNAFLAVLLSACIFQAAFCLPNSRDNNKVKRQTSPRPSDGIVFLDGVGDLFTGLITTGLRSVAALITSGSEATQKMAVAVGTAALPSLLNVTRSFTRVQQSTRNVVDGITNGSQPILGEPGVFRNVTRRVAQGVRPAVVTLEEAINKTISNGPLRSGLFGNRGGNTTTRVNPNDSEIPDYIDEPTS